MTQRYSTIDSEYLYLWTQQQPLLIRLIHFSTSNLFIFLFILTDSLLLISEVICSHTLEYLVNDAHYLVLKSFLLPPFIIKNINLYIKMI